MKKLLIIGGVFVAIIVVIIVSVLFFTTGLTAVADEFFMAAGAGDMTKAAAHLSEGFKKEVPGEKLEAFLKQNALHEYKEASWTNRSIHTDGTGELGGKVTLKDGGIIPLKLKFVKENDAWKIHFIETEQVGLAGKQPGMPVAPSENQAAELVMKTTLGFAEAVNAGDLGPFHETLAREFREQIPLDKFKELFGEFVEKQIDLTGVKATRAVFANEVKLDENGLLPLDGRFPGRPSEVKFQYKYVFRDGAWKPIGVTINVVPVEGESGDGE